MKAKVLFTTTVAIRYTRARCLENSMLEDKCLGSYGYKYQSCPRLPAAVDRCLAHMSTAGSCASMGDECSTKAAYIPIQNSIPATCKPGGEFCTLNYLICKIG